MIASQHPLSAHASIQLPLAIGVRHKIEVWAYVYRRIRYGGRNYSSCGNFHGPGLILLGQQLVRYKMYHGKLSVDSVAYLVECRVIRERFLLGKARRKRPNTRKRSMIS